MKALSKRKLFLDTHPELYPYVIDLLETGMKEGTVLEISAAVPGEISARNIRIEIGDGEEEFFRALKNAVD